MLLGRQRERDALDRLLRDARAGRSGVVALVGEAGIGKSALLDLAESLADGMRTLRARGVQSESHIPFAGLHELLRPALGHLDRIPRPQAEALEAALALRPGHAADRFAVGAATLSLLAAYGEDEPLLVLVDDAHWLDGSSAGAILFASRRLVADAVAVVFVVREGEPSLFDEAGFPALRIEGIDRDDAARLIPDAPPALAERLHRDTGGNPLALLELARGRLPELPPVGPVPILTSLAAAYLDRAAALPERTRDLLLLAAATDRGDLALLDRAGESIGVDLAELAPAEEAALVVVDGGRLEFRHPLARSAIYGAAAAGRRREIHRALAAALPDADADRRAWHLALAAAGPDDAASSALQQAGRRAYDRSAYDVASRAYERAALLATADQRRALLLHSAADAAWLGGLPERALFLLDEAERLAPAEPLVLAIAHLRGHIALRRGPLQVGRDVLLGAAEQAAPPLAATLLAEAVFGAFYAADPDVLRECGARAREVAGRDDDPRTAFFAGVTDGIARVLTGEGDEGAAVIRAAAAVVDEAPELRDDPLLLGHAATPPLWLREADVGHEALDRALATARSRAAVGVLPQLLMHVAIEQASTDRWVEAHAAFDEAIALARESGQRVVLAGLLARLAGLEARVGRADAARADAEEALALAREHGAGLFEIWALTALGDLELAIGTPESALAALGDVEAEIVRRGIEDADLSPAPERVELLLRQGRAEEAVAVSNAFAAAADGKGQPWARARATRARALLAGDGAFDGLFAEALALHDETPDVFESARTRLAYGERLRRAGRRAAAREHLRVAIETFDDLGATPWAERARLELAATGETARRRDPSTLGQLTPQELQVALLLADGRTTKEAAASLFLSPKTIEYHLRNAYRKLGINSRDALREVLRSQHARAPD